MGEDTNPSNPDKIIDVAIAEYNQLRAEAIGNQNRQGALVGIGLTAIGAIMTIALHAQSNHHLLLAVPPFALVLTLLHLGQARTITRIDDYIARGSMAATTESDWLSPFVGKSSIRAD